MSVMAPVVAVKARQVNIKQNKIRRRASELIHDTVKVFHYMNVVSVFDNMQF